MPNLMVTDDAKLGAATRPQNAKAQELGLKTQQSIQRPSDVSCGGGNIVEQEVQRYHSVGKKFCIVSK